MMQICFIGPVQVHDGKKPSAERMRTSVNGLKNKDIKRVIYNRIIFGNTDSGFAGRNNFPIPVSLGTDCREVSANVRMQVPFSGPVI